MFGNTVGFFFWLKLIWLCEQKELGYVKDLHSLKQHNAVFIKNRFCISLCAGNQETSTPANDTLPPPSLPSTLLPDSEMVAS